jgi:gas vesicle protein
MADMVAGVIVGSIVGFASGILFACWQIEAGRRARRRRFIDPTRGYYDE